MRKYLTALALSGSLLPAISHAATTGAVGDGAVAAAAIDPSADAAVTADGGEGGEPLGDIVVTAQKRETNLQQTPIAISVLGASALADRHVESLYNLADG